MEKLKINDEIFIGKISCAFIMDSLSPIICTELAGMPGIIKNIVYKDDNVNYENKICDYYIINTIVNKSHKADIKIFAFDEDELFKVIKENTIVNIPFIEDKIEEEYPFIENKMEGGKYPEEIEPKFLINSINKQRFMEKHHGIFKNHDYMQNICKVIIFRKEKLFQSREEIVPRIYKYDLREFYKYN